MANADFIDSFSPRKISAKEAAVASADIALAEQFGVSPRVIETLRSSSLQCPEHWKIDGHALSYTQAGIAQLESLLSTKKKEGGGGPKATAPRVVTLPIIRIYPSRIWVSVRTPEGQSADVQVRDNSRLRERTGLQCLYHNDRWHCAHSTQGPTNILALITKATTAPATDTRQPKPTSQI
jgi:hypothetical protein